MEALNGLKVIELGQFVAGPFAAKTLADFGADVIKVESAGAGDGLRKWRIVQDGTSLWWEIQSRNKRSVCLDLKSPEGRDVILELAKEADVVIENFKPGTLEKWGLGWEVLHEINPKLVMLRISGFGQTGPYKDRAGHDINYLSLAGVSSHCGRADSGPPPMGIQIADVAGGSHHAVMGILAAVIHRQQTGEGQFVDISMTDAAFALNAMAGAACLAGGQEQKPERALLNGGSFYDYYQTRDGRWLSVGSLEPQFASRLFHTLGISEVTSLAMSQNPEHQQHLKAVLKEKIAEKPLAEWQEIFADEDACVEPVLTISEAAEHPQLKARDMVIGVDRGDGTQQPQIGFPIKFEKTPSETSRIGKMLGADNDRFL